MGLTILRIAGIALGLALFATSGARAQGVNWTPIPTVSPPGSADRSYPFFAAARDLAIEGYVEEEFSVAGDATPYSPFYGAKPGVAVAASGPPTPFKTRVLVRRPDRPENFNGVVVVEWLNVSNNFEADNVWLTLQDHLVSSGYIWIGVSAQGFGGVDTLRSWSPERYGDLRIDHDGGMTHEPLSPDIFRQIGASLRSINAASLLGGLSPTTLIATGQSQSAIWLASFINAGLAQTSTFDGFFLISATGATIDPATPSLVLRVVAEGDAASADAENQPPDSARFRQWEIAGSSHVDRHLRAAREPVQLRDLGTSVQAAIAPQCDVAAIGTASPAYMVEAAGLEHLVAWSRGGPPPPTAPRLVRHLEVEGRFQRDEMGLASGGIRLPDVVAPIGLNVGMNGGARGCASQGYYLPFDLETLRRRYPNVAHYRRAVTRSVRDNITAGFLLPADGDIIISAAQGASW